MINAGATSVLFDNFPVLKKIVRIFNRVKLVQFWPVFSSLFAALRGTRPHAGKKPSKALLRERNIPLAILFSNMLLSRFAFFNNMLLLRFAFFRCYQAAFYEPSQCFIKVGI